VETAVEGTDGESIVEDYIEDCIHLEEQTVVGHTVEVEHKAQSFEHKHHKVASWEVEIGHKLEKWVVDTVEVLDILEEVEFAEQEEFEQQSFHHQMRMEGEEKLPLVLEAQRQAPIFQEFLNSISIHHNALAKVKEIEGMKMEQTWFLLLDWGSRLRCFFQAFGPLF
jgi:hypothetical protein